MGTLRRHQITYSFAERATDSDNLQTCARSPSAVMIVRRERPGILRFYLDVAAHLANPVPHAVGT
jgi:hypothetical protein